MSDDLALPFAQTRVSFGSPMDKPVVVDVEMQREIEHHNGTCNGCEYLGRFEICATCETEVERDRMMSILVQLQMDARRTKYAGASF